MFRSKILFDKKLTLLSMYKMDVDYSCRNIYFRGGVTLENGMQLTRIIENMNQKYKTNHPINIHITSNGGDANIGLLCYDKLRLSKIPIHTYCEGAVISAGTMIFMAGQQRFITKHSKLLIHQLSCKNDDSQNHEQMRDNIYNIDMTAQDYKKIYLKETTINEKKLNMLLTKDIFLSADECIEYGFAHKLESRLRRVRYAQRLRRINSLRSVRFAHLIAIK
jgi:ATP-dependent Clp protease protease subunit